MNFGERRFPEPLDPEALSGLAGDFVKLVERDTEADPAALLFQLLAAYGNAIGKGPHFTVGATKHYANLFVSIVGDTAVARKGTSWDLVKRILNPVDENWAKRCRISGLGSGEALIAAVRDASDEELQHPSPKLRDKRVLVDEGELAKIIKVCQREGSTLSSVLRNAWDGGDLQNRVKDQANCLIATAPHVTISGRDRRTGAGSRLSMEWALSRDQKLTRKQEVFLAEYERTGSVELAGKAAGYHPVTAFRMIKISPGIKRALENAKRKANGQNP